MPFAPRKEIDITNKQVQLLKENTDITNFSPGARARMILELVNMELEQSEKNLERNMLQAFVSNASGVYLDWIGELVACFRLPGESDSNFRYRITNQVYTLATANEQSIRMNCLLVEGVRDARLIPYTHGTGSFSVYVIPEDSNIADRVTSMVQSVIDRYQAYGVKGYAMRPKDVPVRISARLITKPNVDRQFLVESVRSTIRLFIEAHDLGQRLIINALESAILGVSDDIEDVEIHSLHLRDKAVLIQNQDVYWDEKLSISSQDITIL
ncbi:MAG TPA: hypothetical protein GXZ48_08250 [Acholeplasmataceae bacterium]|nr:hypothetical protein [Acholeplasmataceae bacterium]